MDKLLTLTDAGREYIVSDVLFIDNKTNYRLLEYGFYSGAKIKILKIAPKKRTYLVSIGGSVLALDYTLANKVVVHE